jgi:hypothetical protein
MQGPGRSDSESGPNTAQATEVHSNQSVKEAQWVRSPSLIGRRFLLLAGSALQRRGSEVASHAPPVHPFAPHEGCAERAAIPHTLVSRRRM